jgi:hypothetical protein
VFCAYRRCPKHGVNQPIELFSPSKQFSISQRKRRFSSILPICAFAAFDLNLSPQGASLQPEISSLTPPTT